MHRMLVDRRFRHVILVWLSLVLPLPAARGVEEQREAVTHVNRVDADFAFQGEFVGAVTGDSSEEQNLGLQVMAHGDGSFEGTQYQGGLPGQQWDGSPPVRLIGKRADQVLVLSGGLWAIIAQPDHCLLIDAAGDRIGRLERIHRTSPTLGAVAPEDAIVLFSGSDVEQFTQARLTDEGLLMEGADTKPMFQDFNLHLEFKLPYMPRGREQVRANSGVYLQSRYEVQILDSFGIEGANNECGGLYKVRAPDVNMCFPPLIWQTYDVIFTAPRWAADGTKRKNARVSVWHNGVKIHDNFELPTKTGAGKPEGPCLLPIRLQDHGSPMRFRNIWLVDRGAAPPVSFPVSRAEGAQENCPSEPAEEPSEPLAEEPSDAPVEETVNDPAESPPSDPTNGTPTEDTTQESKPTDSSQDEAIGEPK